MLGIVIQNRTPERLEAVYEPLMRGKNYLNPLEVAAILYETLIDPDEASARQVLSDLGLDIDHEGEEVIRRALFLLAAYDSSLPSSPSGD